MQLIKSVCAHHLRKSGLTHNAKLCINGNEWAKRQAAKAGIGFTALDNGFAACDEPVRLQKICSRLSVAKIDALLRKWLCPLPHPFTPVDRRAGYRYDLSILQAEFSLTQMLDRPLSGRVLFDEVIRENLDLGRPSRIGLVFDRQIRTRGPRPTPGRWRTRVITEGEQARSCGIPADIRACCTARPSGRSKHEEGSTGAQVRTLIQCAESIESQCRSTKVTECSFGRSRKSRCSRMLPWVLHSAFSP
jgi:hypothetical protein